MWGEWDRQIFFIYVTLEITNKKDNKNSKTIATTDVTNWDERATESDKCSTKSLYLKIKNPLYTYT